MSLAEIIAIGILIAIVDTILVYFIIKKWRDVCESRHSKNIDNEKAKIGEPDYLDRFLELKNIRRLNFPDKGLD